MTNSRINNYVFGFSIMACLSLVLLFVPWVSFVAENGFLRGTPVTISGTNGHLGLFGLKVPTWLISIVSFIASVAMILNIKSIISLPWHVLFLPAAVLMVFLLLFGITLGGKVDYEAGYALALLVNTSIFVIGVRSKSVA